MRLPASSLAEDPFRRTPPGSLRMPSRSGVASDGNQDPDRTEPIAVEVTRQCYIPVRRTIADGGRVRPQSRPERRFRSASLRLWSWAHLRGVGLALRDASCCCVLSVGPGCCEARAGGGRSFRNTSSGSPVNARRHMASRGSLAPSGPEEASGLRCRSRSRLDAPSAHGKRHLSFPGPDRRSRRYGTPTRIWLRRPAEEWRDPRSHHRVHFGPCQGCRRLVGRAKALDGDAAQFDNRCVRRKALLSAQRCLRPPSILGRFLS